MPELFTKLQASTSGGRLYDEPDKRYDKKRGLKQTFSSIYDGIVDQ